MKKHEEPIKFLKDLKKYWRGDTTLDYMLKVYGEVQKGIARGGIMKRQAMNVSVNENSNIFYSPFYLSLCP